MIDESVGKLIEFIEAASPIVWASLVRQVYVDAATELAWSIVLIALSVVVFRFVMRMKKNYDERYDDNQFWSDDEGAWFIVLAILPFGLGLGLLFRSVALFSNPNFYAIKFLLETFVN